MTLNSKLALTLGALAALGLTAAQSAQAQTVVYQDSYTGTSGTSLSGQAPTVDLTGGTYTVNAGGAAYGTGNAVFAGQSSPPSSVTLPFDITTPLLSSADYYTVSANVTPAGDWIALGFSPDATGNPLANTGPWVLLRSGASGYQTFAGPGTGTSLSSGSVTPSTTGGVLTAEYNKTTKTASFFYNGTQLGTDYTYTTAGPTIQDVFLADQGGAGSFTNLIVTDSNPVPEASTTVSFGLLLALGLGGLVAARKRSLSGVSAQ